MLKKIDNFLAILVIVMTIVNIAIAFISAITSFVFPVKIFAGIYIVLVLSWGLTAYINRNAHIGPPGPYLSE